jgi:hypothetical protein
MKADGRVRYVGVTTSHGRRHSELAQIMETQPIDFVQLTYNIADREVEARLLPLAAERGIAVIANRPFQRGALIAHTEPHPLPGWAAEIDCVSWPQILLKFIVSHPAVTCAIPATSRVDHMEENMAAARGAMPDAALRRRMAADVRSALMDLLSYSLADLIPFSRETYFRLFERYNIGVWPAPIVGLAWGFMALFAVRRPEDWGRRAAVLMMAAGWLWVGWAFQMGWYAPLSWPGIYFGIGFGLQGVLMAVMIRRLRSVPSTLPSTLPVPWDRRVALAILLFALRAAAPARALLGATLVWS